MTFYEKVSESAAYIKDKTDQEPAIGIILGSGLGGLVEIMSEKASIPYEDIPHFPRSTVSGHAGNLVIGRIGRQTVAAMQGRFHYYEGFSMREVTYPIYVMQLLGIKNLIVTNACGAINPCFRPGDLAILTDYISFMGPNPLIGPNDERFGVRFPDMTDAYSNELREKAASVARKIGLDYREGVYALFTGPSYESAAEIRAFAAIGADLVGMSTVPETIAANYLGMKVLGVSCITNMATGLAKEKHTHEQVMKIAGKTSDKLCLWMRELLLNWD